MFRSLPPYTRKLATYLIQRYYTPHEGITVSQVTLEEKLRGTKLQRTRKVIRDHLQRLEAAGIFTCQPRYRPADWSRGGRSSNCYRIATKLPSELPSELPSRGLTTKRVSKETTDPSFHSGRAGSHSSPAEALSASATRESFDGGGSLDGEGHSADSQSEPLLNENGSRTSNLPSGASEDSCIPKHLRKDLVAIENAPGSRDGFTEAQLREIAGVHPWIVDEWISVVLAEVFHGPEHGVYIKNPIGRFLAGIRTGERP